MTDPLLPISPAVHHLPTQICSWLDVRSERAESTGAALAVTAAELCTSASDAAVVAAEQLKEAGPKDPDRINPKQRCETDGRGNARCVWVND